MKKKPVARRHLDEFLKTAQDLAKASGALQKKSLGKKHKIQYKGEIDIVTEVDKACEDKIIKTLNRKFPDHSILAEESGGHQNSSVFKWIIDPLDGTTNFAHGYPLFCTSIALEENGEVILGVVYEPNIDELFWAVKGGGAFCNKKMMRVSASRSLHTSLLCTGFAYNLHTAQDNNIAHFSSFLMKSQSVRRDGVAAVDLCYLACGRFDGFWELGLHPWDVAAGVLMVMEAGGRVSTFDGETYSIYGKEIMASNGRIHESMIQLLNDRTYS